MSYIYECADCGPGFENCQITSDVQLSTSDDKRYKCHKNLPNTVARFHWVE